MKSILLCTKISMEVKIHLVFDRDVQNVIHLAVQDKVQSELHSQVIVLYCYRLNITTTLKVKLSKIAFV